MLLSLFICPAKVVATQPPCPVGLGNIMCSCCHDYLLRPHPFPPLLPPTSRHCLGLLQGAAQEAAKERRSVLGRERAGRIGEINPGSLGAWPVRVKNSHRPLQTGCGLREARARACDLSQAWASSSNEAQAGQGQGQGALEVLESQEKQHQGG